MYRKQNHPDRRELIEALRTGSAAVREHLRHCGPCRTLFSFLRQAGADVQHMIISPPDDLLMRNRAIARLVESRHPRHTLSGAAIFDSWADRPALAVRDSVPDIERRIRFKASHFVVEFVGNRRVAEWDFVARVYDGGRVSRDFILQVGSSKVIAGRSDCYFWSSRRPPRRLQLLSPSRRIDLGNLWW